MKDKIWSLAAYQLSFEILKYLHFFEIPQCSDLFQKIQKSCPSFDETFFFEDSIKTLKKQLQKFDKKINPKEPKPPALILDNKPKDLSMAVADSKKPSKPEQSGLLSEQLLAAIRAKKHIFIRSVMRKGESMYEIQSKLLNYSHQNNKIISSMESLFAAKIPKEKISDNEQAMDRIYQEIELFNLIDASNNKLDLSDVKREDIIAFSEEVKSIVTVQSPEFDWSEYDEGKLAIRGDSIDELYEVSDSMLKDENFMQKKQIIEKLNVHKEKKVTDLETVGPNLETEIPREEVRSEHGESMDHSEIKETKEPQIKDRKKSSTNEHQKDNIQGKQIYFLFIIKFLQKNILQ